MWVVWAESSAGHRRYIWRNLIATALQRVISGCLRPSFTPWSQPADVALAWWRARLVRSPDLALELPEPPPPCLAVPLPPPQWRPVRCHPPPSHVAGPSLLEIHYLIQALNLEPAAAVPQASSGIVPPSPQKPQPLQPTPPPPIGCHVRASLAWDLFPSQETTACRDVSGATRQPGRSNDGHDAGQGTQQPCGWFSGS